MVQMSWICGCHFDVGTPALGTKLGFSLDPETQKPSCLLQAQQSLCRGWLFQVFSAMQLLWPSGDLPESMRMSWALLTFGNLGTGSFKTSGKQVDLLLRALQMSSILLLATRMNTLEFWTTLAIPRAVSLYFVFCTSPTLLICHPPSGHWVSLCSGSLLLSTGLNEHPSPWLIGVLCMISTMWCGYCVLCVNAEVV